MFFPRSASIINDDRSSADKEERMSLIVELIELIELGVFFTLWYNLVEAT